MSHRKDVTDDLTASDHTELANHIRAFLQDGGEEIVHEHMAIVGTPEDPSGHDFFAPPVPEGLLRAFLDTRDLHENLWHGHRFYISKLEDFLMKNGGQRFVPLPKWEAHNRIPQPLSYIHPLEPSVPVQDWQIHVDAYNAPFAPRPQVPDHLKDDRLDGYTAVSLAAEITGYHLDIHIKVGGVFTNPHHTSACALFWVWHAALEEFYHRWTLKKLDACKSLVVGQNADGRQEAFVIGNDNELWHCWQWWRYGGWSYWIRLGGAAKQLAVERNEDGRLDVFAIDLDDRVKHRWQVAPNGVWSDWEHLGELRATQIAVGTNWDRTLELFAIDLDGHLWHTRQQSPNGDWTAWEPLGHNMVLNQITVARDPQTGILEVFALTVGRSAWTMYQTVPGSGPWSGWVRLGPRGMTFQQLAVAPDGRGRLIAFGIENVWYAVSSKPPNEVFYTRVPVRLAARTDARFPGRPRRLTITELAALIYEQRSRRWHSLHGFRARKLAIAQNANDGLEVFAIGMDDRLAHTRQAPGAPYYEWRQWNTSIGSDTGNANGTMELTEIAVGRNERGDPPTVAYGRRPGGTLELFAKARNSATWHKWETQDGWRHWQPF